MLIINDFNYEQYKKVFEVVSEWMIPPDPNRDPEAHPFAVLQRWEKQNIGRAQRALKIGLMDFINGVQHATTEQKNEVNKRLLEKELPGLYALLNHAWDIREKVFRKKRISNLDEYYVIAELLSATDALLNEKERKVFGDAVLLFEKSRHNSQ